MRTTVRKWGNSAALRLPAALMEAANLRLDAPVDLREEEGRLVIVPLDESTEPSLDDLLENMIAYDETEDEPGFGQPVGQELL